MRASTMLETIKAVKGILYLYGISSLADPSITTDESIVRFIISPQDIGVTHSLAPHNAMLVLEFSNQGDERARYWWQRKGAELIRTEIGSL